MGKKKANGDYNDFLEDTRYRDTNEIRTTLQTTSTLTRSISPAAASRQSQPHRNKIYNMSKSKKPQLTHFLCLPLITKTTRPQISTALDRLRTDVEALTPVPSKAVRPVGTLHLTLGVMSLSQEQLADATAHLRELDVGQLLRGITTQKIAEMAYDTPTVSESFGAVSNPDAIPSNPALGSDPDKLVVELKGLVPMQKPQQTSILYAEPRDSSGRLLQFAESVRRSFEDKGWVLNDDRALRLHATVLNTIYAKPKNRRSRAGDSERTAKVATTQDSGAQENVNGHSATLPQQAVDGQDAEQLERAEGHGPDAKSWMRFDATSLIEVYKDFLWADNVSIDRVQICRMGAQKTVDDSTGQVVDEQYHVVAERTL